MKRLILAVLAFLAVASAPSIYAWAQEAVPLDVWRAYASPDEMGGLPAIKIVLSKDGQAAFAAFTAEHVGPRADMLVDGVVVTSPVIQTVINSEWLLLSGDFTMSEAEAMAERLNESSSHVAVRLQGKQKSK